ncbi:MAG: GNAT family N-acetyltransferase [Thermofilaceae archaeon]
MFWLYPEGKMLKEDSFDFSYIKEALVQCSQNIKFLKFINDTLHSFNIEKVENVCEVGVGDVEFLVKICREYKPKKLVLIDKSKEILEYISHSLEGMSEIISFKCDFLESFSIPEVRELFDRIDLFISTNTFHWFGKKWELGLEVTKRLLSPYGFAFIHQGLKWTYITLYELAQDLFNKAYGKKLDLDSYLYYPYPCEIESKFDFYGFSVIRKNIFYEMDYIEDEERFHKLVKSFSVAGLLPFLEQITDIAEREQFRQTFIKAAKELKPPAFSHRGFYALRKKIDLPKRVSFCILSPNTSYISSFECKERDKKLAELKVLLEEVAEDFVPSLYYRDAFCLGFSSSALSRERTIEPYFNSVKDGFIILAQLREGAFTETEEPIVGALCFTIKDNLDNLGLTSSFNEKVIYVSTIAVRKPYRGLGIAKGMYRFLLNILKDCPMQLGSKIRYIVTRTWSTNVESKRLLTSLGFNLVKVIENDRGKGIDTEYYVFDLKSNSS